MKKYTFQIDLKKLMLQKAANTGEPISQKDVAEVTGLSLPTIGKWFNSGGLDRIDADTVGNLCAYLGCEMTDLITLQSSDSEE